MAENSSGFMDFLSGLFGGGSSGAPSTPTVLSFGREGGTQYINPNAVKPKGFLDSLDYSNILGAAIGPGLKGLESYLLAKEQSKAKKEISPLEQMKLDLEKEQFQFNKEQAKETAALARAKLEFESAQTRAFLLQRAMEMQASAIRVGAMNQAATLQNVIENIRGTVSGAGLRR